MLSSFQKIKFNSYRYALEEFFQLITSKLEKMIESEDSKSLLLKNRKYHIYAKSLVVLYFRLPYVGDLIDASVKLDDIENIKNSIYNFEQNFKHTNIDRDRSVIVNYDSQLNNNVEYIKIRKKIPLQMSSNKVKLFNQIIQKESNSKRSLLINGWNKNSVPVFLWRTLYSSISNRNYSINIKKILWLLFFQDGESFMYILFLHEWVTYILNSLSNLEVPMSFNFNNLQSYKNMELTFLYKLRKTNPINMSTEMMTCSCHLLNCNIDLIDFYMKYIFRNTKAYDLPYIYGVLI